MFIIHLLTHISYIAITSGDAIGIFMYRFVNGNILDIFNGFIVRNTDKNVHQCNVRSADKLGALLPSGY